MEENSKANNDPKACEECKKIRPEYKFGMCFDCNEDLYRNENSQ